MKNSQLILIALVATSLLVTQANAAKANFDRSKPHVTKNKNDCDDSSTDKRAKCLAKKGKYKVGGGHVTVLKNKQKSAVGYNTTRSNRSTKANPNPPKSKPAVDNNCDAKNNCN
ncbi:MAG: hypothetical protein Q9M92_11615 [Enterobacterales bacterium]|nr:hypothetical protein [Enterobacterales bacterium]